MKCVVLTTVAILIVLCQTVSAGEIVLKKSFWTGWKYSIDGQNFTGVGYFGSNLLEVMEADDEALDHMYKYKTIRNWALVTGIPGSLLVGWVAAEATMGDWSDDDKTLLAIGAPLWITSIILEASATNHLKKGVRIYNEGQQALYFDVNYGSSLASNDNAVRLSLVWRF